MQPFRKGDSFTTFRAHMESIIAEINSLDNDYVMRASKVELEEHYITRARIEELELNVDDKYLDNKRSVQLTAYNHFDRRPFKVPGTEIELHIPYTGDKDLFEIRASTYSLSGYPDITVNDNEIIIKVSYQDSNADGEKVKRSMESDLKSIVKAVQNLNKDVRGYNSNIETSIKTALKSKIEKAKKSIDALEFLDVPIKRKNIPETYVTDVKRKVKTSRKPRKPRASVEPYKPEPVLEMSEYNHILGVLRGMSKVIERSPQSFSNLNEEAIRTHFLLQLNGHYEGNATGETFNKSGKTDILIRVEDRNIFIGECKFWKGQKSFDDAISQLLGYLAWRDTKCALLIFNKNKNSSDVAKKMNKVMTDRAECKRIIEVNFEGNSKYIFVKKDDPGREIIITTQLYDLSI